MKLLTWNVNGIRACLDHGFVDTIAKLDADVVCLQETKTRDGYIDGLPKYKQFFSNAERKGYAGTAILTRFDPSDVMCGIGVEEFDCEGRCITAEYDDYYVMCVYSPAAGAKLERLSYRLRWEESLRRFVGSLSSKKPVIICGDLNVAYSDADTCGGITAESAGTTLKEREAFKRLTECGFIDAYRTTYPDASTYTWWSYRNGDRKKNNGMRLDYILVPTSLVPCLGSVNVFSGIYGSDHCPVGSEINMTGSKQEKAADDGTEEGSASLVRYTDSIISIDEYRLARHKCEFRFTMHTVKYGRELYYIPFIGLYDIDSGIPLAFPGYERWYLRLLSEEPKANNTMRKRASNIADLLNYLLHKTSITSLNEIDLNVLHGFLYDAKFDGEGEDRDNELSPDTWRRIRADAFQFLSDYYESNKNTYKFRYSTADLFTRSYSVNNQTGETRLQISYNSIGVKAPRQKERKNRVLLYGYLDLLIFVSRMYDPMLTLAIELCAYAGLREGEVVNVTRRKIERLSSGFGRVGKIRIDLMDDAPFAKEWEGKTAFGSIKKYRRQEVYTDFVGAVSERLSEHEAMLAAMGVPDDVDAPLFITKWGSPMPVFTYRERLKKLFEEHFVPLLKIYAEKDGNWSEHAPFIESYEAAYPGAHMLRHWFTMYLLNRTNLKKEQIMKWRGDSQIESMTDYIHKSQRMIDDYRDSAFRFQETILGEIL